MPMYKLFCGMSKLKKPESIDTEVEQKLFKTILWNFVI